MSRTGKAPRVRGRRPGASRRRGAQPSWEAGAPARAGDRLRAGCCAILPPGDGAELITRLGTRGSKLVWGNPSRVATLNGTAQRVRVGNERELRITRARERGSSLTLSYSLSGDTSRPALSHAAHFSKQGTRPAPREALDSTFCTHPKGDPSHPALSHEKRDCSERGTRPTPRDNSLSWGTRPAPRF